jgi:coproporphyrinogen III oxidase-like Fe-S oxidoreductase
LTEGLHLSEIDAAFQTDVWERYGRDLQQFVAAGVLEHAHDSLRLTREGMLLANEVCKIFV